MTRGMSHLEDSSALVASPYVREAHIGRLADDPVPTGATTRTRWRCWG